MQIISVAIAALLTTASAIRIIKPAAGDTVHCNQPWQVCWTAVDTDPPQLCLYLTNFREFPPQIVDLLNRTPIITDGGGCVTIPPPSCPSPLRTTPYRVRAASCPDPNTIYAESGDFTLVA
ncbi:hypothetical protein CBS63078_5662 [Aspergillus niger]|uniref:FRG domain family protein n=1 Tax=Aspergillus niger TaxID=5061 RepID=A0A3F3RUA4_ASPNG|nr:hypothetical protein CBS13152_3582 [Aspergillus niger]KAI2904448.1 hypothetical protein CBS63078_5662 [Aspergillus niger]KAI2952070.1 hypothetical protein CBS147323_10393 [Aspergillus niger]KAI3002285.1 hypothetical protein CBS147345_8373 [Aspergillus niger]KAI3026320.1 hypothetical protein CBS147347_4977 [Aspergillus niger]